MRWATSAAPCFCPRLATLAGKQTGHLRARFPPTTRQAHTKFYPSLTMLGDQEGSIISEQDVSHGSEPGRPHSRGSEPRRPHSRARLRNLDHTWIRARPSRSALACGRAGNLGGIDGRGRPRTGTAKEEPVACTSEGRQDARAG